jgi:glyoxylase-like metal-dependent hydrolase (beta-lactamase superfamily II)
MPVEPTPGCEGVYTVDTELLGTPGVMSAYLIDADRPALVDTGPAPAAEIVLSALREVGIDPAEVEYLLPTHVHLDHAAATGALARACPNATVLAHERGRPYLVDPERVERLIVSARDALGPVADAYGDPEVVPAERCDTLADGERIDLGDRTLTAVDAPGHAPHQLCFLDSESGALFAADAAGAYIEDRLTPTTPPPSFDPEATVETVDRLRAHDPEHVLYGHFGARSDADDALTAYAELIPQWVEAVREFRDGRDDAAAIAADLPERWRSMTVERDVAGVLGHLDR